MQTLDQYLAEQNAKTGVDRLMKMPPRNAPEAAHAPTEPAVIPEAQQTRIRHATGQMNGMEKRYAVYLDMRILTKEIAGWKFEAVKLKLAPATFWTPDFELVMPDGRIELHETKGHWEDDARVKIKIAAQAFPEFLIVAVTWDKRSKTWHFEEFR